MVFCLFVCLFEGKTVSTPTGSGVNGFLTESQNGITSSETPQKFKGHTEESCKKKMTKSLPSRRKVLQFPKKEEHSSYQDLRASGVINGETMTAIT